MEWTIALHASRDYSVHIEAGQRSTWGTRLAETFGPRRIALISDATVARYYGHAVQDCLEAAGFTVTVISFPAGESHKTMSTLAILLEKMAQAQLTRGDMVLALGGGVTGDMAGFAAGCYLRGIRWVQLPTTVLAAVDASVGGKTAVNLTVGKNMAGLFYQPSVVYIDTDFFQTLPDTLIADGVAEMIKTGLLAGESLFALVAQGWRRDSAQWPEAVAACVAYKARVVQSDEYEQGMRKLLNLGHTPAHAIERLSDYQISHGRAVAMGMALMTRAAARRQYCDATCAARVERALYANGLPIDVPFSAEAIAEAAMADKKRETDHITLVLPHGIGDCRLHVVPMAELRSLLAAGMP